MQRQRVSEADLALWMAHQLFTVLSLSSTSPPQLHCGRSALTLLLTTHFSLVFYCLCNSAVSNISYNMTACFWPMRVMGKIKRWCQQFAVVNQNYVSKLTALAEEWLRLYWAVQWSWFARVSALCNLLRKKSQEVTASLPGQFLSRRCFTLYITMEVEPRIAKQYKCHHCCSCKNYRGKGMEGGKKGSFVSSWKKCVLGHPIARATGYCLLPDTFWLWASKNAFNVGSVKFANSPSPPSIVKKVRTGRKSSQGT